jgi:hypothetical protein
MENTASPVNRSLLAIRALVGTVMVGLGPITVLASNGTVVLLSLLALSMRRSGLNRAMDLAKTPGGLAVGALLGWCLLSTLWAPIPLDAVEPALRLIGLVLLGLAALAGARTLDEETRVFAARCLLVGLAVMLVLFLVERATGSGVRDLIRGAHGPHGLTKTSRGSVVLGIVLGDLLEKSLRRGLVLSDGDLSPFFTRPISATLFGIIAIVILLRVPAINRFITGKGK